MTYGIETNGKLVKNIINGAAFTFDSKDCADKFAAGMTACNRVDAIRKGRKIAKYSVVELTTV